MTMRDRVNNDAANVVTAHGMLDQLCVVAWMEDGHLKVEPPQMPTPALKPSNPY